MHHINVEIKAKCPNPAWVNEKLQALNADFKGIDHQIDTYFKVPNGRLKLRQGNIEKALIHYNRPNQEGPKVSEVSLYHPENDAALLEALKKALGVKVVVDKQRAIYFIDNVKFHVDEVKGLGGFVEIEAIDQEGNLDQAYLQDQCQHYMEVLHIQSTDLLDVSYSDLLMENYE